MERKLRLLPRIMSPVRRVTPDAAQVELRDNVCQLPTREQPYMVVDDIDGITHIVRGLHDPKAEPATIVEFPNLDYMVFQQ